MLKKHIVLSLSVVLLGMLMCSSIIRAVEFDISAKSAILIDAQTGQVLFEKNAHERLPIASMTKTMTLLLAMEAIERKEVSLTDMVRISKLAESMGGSQIYLSSKDQVSLEILLKSIAIASANDSCVAVAEYIGGTEENFVDKMNQRGQQLGMKNTYFVNTTGLPVPGHYSTAYDVALMGRQLIKYEKFREWAKIWHDTVQLVDGKRGMTNTNTLINSYPGLDGIKTGHTEEAGYCLSASAERGGFRLVSVIMNTASEKERNAASAALLDYGFRAFTRQVLVEKGETVENIPILQGKQTSVDSYTANDLEVVVQRGENFEVRKEVVAANKTAPVQKDEKVGEMIIYQNDKELGRVDLLSEEEVEKANIFLRLLRWFSGFITGLWNRIF